MARRVFRISASAITRSNARSTASVSVLADRMAFSLSYLRHWQNKLLPSSFFSLHGTPASAMCIPKGHGISMSSVARSALNL